MYYTITAGNDDGKFVINNNTGIVETAGLLDRETTASHVLTVTAFDGSLPPRRRYTDGNLVVNILDVNDNTPNITTPSTIEVPESLIKGDSVYTLTADDPDDGLNAALTFRITSGNDAGWLVLNENTGEITMKGKSVFFWRAIIRIDNNGIDPDLTPERYDVVLLPPFSGQRKWPPERAKHDPETHSFKSIRMRFQTFPF